MSRDRKKRLDVELSDAEWERLESERGLVSRSAWVRARLFPPTFSVTHSSGAAKGVPASAAGSSGAAPSVSFSPAGIPGVVRGSDLAKRNVRPIPKGKGK
jgi:hypothetical protein